MIRTLVTAPAETPVSLAEAKTYCRIDHTDEDDLITALIEAATNAAECYTRRLFVTQTWDATFDALVDALALPFAPVASITSVSYYDADDAEQTLSDSLYELAEIDGTPTVRRAYGESYPGVSGRPDGVTVRLVAGYGAAAAVPDGIKAAILADCSRRYKREPTPDEEQMVLRMLDPYRIAEVI